MGELVHWVPTAKKFRDQDPEFVIPELQGINNV